MKYLKLLLLTLAILAGIVVTFTVFALVNPNLFRHPIERTLAERTGWTFNIGEIRSGTDPLHLTIRNLDLENVDGQPLIKADEVIFELLDWPSLSKPFFNLTLAEPEVYYLENEEGESNWPNSSPPRKTEQDASAPSLPADLFFQDILLGNGSIVIQQGKKRRLIQISRLKLVRTDTGKAALNLDMDIDGEPFNIRSYFAIPASQEADIILNIEHEALSASLVSSVFLVPAINGSRAHIAIQLKNTDFLERLLGTNLPDLPESYLLADLDMNDTTLTAKGVQLALGEQKLSGELGYVEKRQQFNFDLNSDKLDLDKLATIFASDQPDAESKKTTTAADNQPETIVDWSSLANISVQGKVSVGELNGFNWHATDLSIETFLSQQNHLPFALVKLQSAKLDQTQESTKRQFNALQFSGEFNPLSLKTQGVDTQLSATVQFNNKVRGLVDGTININGISGQDIAIKLSSTNSMALWKALGLDLQEAGPIMLEGTLQSTRQDSKDSLHSDLNLQIGRQQLAVKSSITPGSPIDINATLKGNNIDTRFLTAEADPGEAKSETPPIAEKPPAAKAPLFSREPIDTSTLRNINADANIDIEGLTTNFNYIERFIATVQLKDGQLTTRESKLRLPDNEITLNMSGNFKSDNISTSLELLLDSQNTGKLGLDKSAQITGGKGEASLKLSTSGSSPHELASNLNGTIDGKFQELVMANNKVDLVGTDIISELISKLNPFAETDPVTHLECVFLHLDANQGVLTSDKQLQVETRKMKIIGKGKIDLPEEKLSLNFTPVARQGIGVNLSGLAKLIRLNGDLRSPGIGVDAGGVATTALSAGAAVATGGTSLVAQGLIERATNLGSACDPERDKAAPEGGTPPHEGNAPEGITAADSTTG